MLWYGNAQYRVINLLTNQYNSKLHIKNLTRSKTYAKTINYFGSYFFIPSNWELLVQTKKNTQNCLFYLYSSVFFIQFAVHCSSFLSVHYNTQTSILSLRNLVANSWFSLYTNYFIQVLNCFNLYFFTKIQFKGKGYRLYLNKRQTLAFQFGHSHRVYQYGFNLNLVLLTKYTLFVYGMNRFHVSAFSLFTQSYRPINIYTHRGIRFSKQVIYKKTGKESSFR